MTDSGTVLLAARVASPLLHPLFHFLLILVSLRLLQALINELQYGPQYAREAGHGLKLPVADYRLAASGLGPARPPSPPPRRAGGGKRDGNSKRGGGKHGGKRGGGGGSGGGGSSSSIPGEGEVAGSAAYSFCMCPGGQVVPTALDPAELCVNGMSFSKRASPFANSGLVVPVGLADCRPYVDRPGDEVLAGLALQRAVERDAARRGGGRLVAPVQTFDDFLAGHSGPGGGAPASSYRLGVRRAALHEVYPARVTEALRLGLARFEQDLPGYVSRGEGLLHGVESRTSSPVRVVRDPASRQSPTVRGLFPLGEGAGYAGGIVSAAVDGARAAALLLAEGGAERLRRPVNWWKTN